MNFAIMTPHVKTTAQWCIVTVVAAVATDFGQSLLDLL